MADFLYLDVETGGLDTKYSPLLEVAYAIDEGPVKVLYPTDIGQWLDLCDPAALRINKMVDRLRSEDEDGEWVDVPREFEQGTDAARNMRSTGMLGQPLGVAWLKLPEVTGWDDFIQDVQDHPGITPVGANVEFDIAFLKREMGSLFPANISHRLLSLGAYAAGVLGDAKPMSFTTIRDAVVQWKDYVGEATPPIDHTAGGDVLATRFVHQALQQYTGIR